MNTNSSYKSWDDFLEDHRCNPHKLIDWIKQNHPELVEKAKNGNLSPGTICFWQNFLSELVRVNPRDLHGDVMVTDAIKVLPNLHCRKFPKLPLCPAML